MLELPASTSLAEVKRQALKATRVTRDPGGYVLKFRGAELFDESRSLTDAALIITRSGSAGDGNRGSRVAGTLRASATTCSTRCPAGTC